MTDDEFAPVTPGEMLREEFLKEYGLSQNRLAKAIGISPNPDRGDRGQPAPDHRRHGAAAWPVLRQQPGILAEPAAALRPQERAGSSPPRTPSGSRRTAPHSAAGGFQR
jgi:hypothetical protein